MLTQIAFVPLEQVRSPVWSPAGDRFLVANRKQLALYGRDGELLVERALDRDGVEPFVFGITWSPDGSQIATGEYGPLRLRRAEDLSVIASVEHRGIGPVVFCEGGKALACGPNTHVHVLEVPSLADRGSLMLEFGGPYESFDIDHIVADPDGTFIATADYGGYSDDEWGHTASRGVPKVTIVDSRKPAEAARELMQPQPITDLVFDRWRRRLLVGNYARVVVRGLDAAEITEWSPYGRRTVKSLAVCERYVATMPDISFGAHPSVELWDPVTYEKLGGALVMEGIDRQVLLRPLAWSAEPNADGSRLAVVEPEGVRIWSV